MNKQIKYFLGLLILLLITAYFLSLLSGLPQYFRDDIIAFLEEKFSGDVSFSSISLWPLNRIRLNSFSFADEQGNLVKMKELKLDYNFNFTDFDQLIEIQFLEAVEAEIIIAKDLLAVESKNEKNLEIENDNFKTIELSRFDLPKFLDDINLNINNSKLIIKSEDYDLEFNNLNLGLDADGPKNYVLNLSTSLLIENLSYQEFNLAQLEAKQIDLQLQRKDNRAELYFDTGELHLAPFLEFLPNKSYNYQALNIDLKTLKGNFLAKGRVEFGEKEIINYNSEIIFPELDFTASYNKNNQSQKFDLNFNDFEILLSGPEFNLAAVDNQFVLDDNQVELSLKINDKKQYQLKLTAADFNYNYSFLKPELESGDISFELKLEGNRKEIKRVYADISAKNVINKYLDIDDSQLTFKLIENEIFLEKAELELANNSKIKLQANYNLKEGNYLLSAAAEEIKISKNLILLLEEYNLAEQYLKEFRNIKDDRLDFILDIAGYYNNQRGISASGNFDFNFDLKDKESEIKLKSSFWYTDQKLFFDSLKLFSDFAYLDLIGEIDFKSEKFDLNYAAKNFEPAILNSLFDLNLLDLNGFNPTLKYVEGRLAATFENPKLTMLLKMDELEYNNFRLDDINLMAVYEKDSLKLSRASASINQALIRAEGEIKDLSEEAVINLNIKSENLYFQDLAAAAEKSVPLSGQLQLNADLSGAISDYQLDFSIDTSNPIFTLKGEEYELSNLSSTIKKEDQNFKVEDLSFSYQNLSFKTAGIYNLQSGFDLSYQLEGFEAQNYLNNYPALADKISGSLKLEGSIKGEIEEILLNFNLAAEALYYDGLKLEINDNDFQYSFQKDRLKIKEFDFSFASGKYQLEGQAFNLTTIPETDLQFKVLEMPIKELFEKYLSFYPLAKEIVFSGASRIKTEGSQYNADLNLEGYLPQAEQSIFNLNGKIGREIELDFEGEELPLRFISTKDELNLDLSAVLDFKGNVGGELSNPILNSSHKFSNIKINETLVESITGHILVENDRRLSASETISFKEGGNLNIDGSYSFVDEQLSLSSKLQSLPISFILSFFSEKVSGNGKINGNLRAEGAIKSPTFNGNLELQGERLEFGIWDGVKNYQAQLDFQNDQAVLKNVRGQFGGGDFEVDGYFNLLDLNNFWDLSLKGEELYFDYGSLEGDFDSKINFSGPLMDPLLDGEIKLYDFIIAIPFEWSGDEEETESEAEKNTSNSFIPRIDLRLIPENNVRVKNSNIDILIQNGDLNLNYHHFRENSLMMEGRLKSNEGRFSYYNSRFTLNNAEVLFTPVDEGDIPNLLINATTYASGREINIVLNGPANNMNISLSSKPEMREEEILNLLSSRGALGSAIIGGEDIGVQQIIMQELIRIINSFLQEDVISGIESDFRTALSLDRIEIDALQYGLEREIAIYLGKNLSNRFYLEYAAFFGEEEKDNEISFQYRLNEITILKGSYLGDEEYQITLENEIEF